MSQPRRTGRLDDGYLYLIASTGLEAELVESWKSLMQHLSLTINESGWKLGKICLVGG